MAIPTINNIDAAGPRTSIADYAPTVGADGCLFVFDGAEDSGANDGITALTYAGANLEKALSVKLVFGADQMWSDIWYLVNPTSVAASGAILPTGAVSNNWFVAWTCLGVDQTTPVPVTGQDALSGGAQSLTANLTTTSDDNLLIGVYANSAARGWTAGVGVTINSEKTGGFMEAVTGRKDAASAGAHSFNISTSGSGDHKTLAVAAVQPPQSTVVEASVTMGVISTLAASAIADGQAAIAASVATQITGAAEADVQAVIALAASTGLVAAVASSSEASVAYATQNGLSVAPTVAAFGALALNAIAGVSATSEASGEIEASVAFAVTSTLAAAAQASVEARADLAALAGLVSGANVSAEASAGFAAQVAAALEDIGATEASFNLDLTGAMAAAVQTDAEAAIAIPVQAALSTTASADQQAQAALSAAIGISAASGAAANASLAFDATMGLTATETEIIRFVRRVLQRMRQERTLRRF